MDQDDINTNETYCDSDQGGFDTCTGEAFDFGSDN